MPIAAMLAAPRVDDGHRSGRLDAHQQGRSVTDRAAGLRLDRIVVRFERSGLGAVTTGTFRNFAVALEYDGVVKSLSVDSAAIDPSTTRDLVVWDGLDALKRTTRF